VRVLDVTASKGINRVEYDLLVDAELGLAAEAARVAKAAEKADAAAKANNEGELGKTPLAESKRLGHPLYITPGSYTLALELGGTNAEQSFTVNAPKAYEPRVKPKFKLRGR
jgi:hypothetical protein